MAPPSARVTIPPNPLTPFPTPLRNALTNALLSTGAINTIHTRLLHECQASGWLEAIRLRARELIREGAESWEEVMKTLCEEARMDGGDQRIVFGGEDYNGRIGLGINGREEKNTNGGGGSGGDVRIPARVIKEGVRVVREALDGIVVVGEEVI